MNMKKALEVVLALVIAGAVLAFGGVQPLAYSLVEVSLFLALLLLLLKLTRGQDAQLQVPLWPLLFAALVGVQVIPLPSNVVAKVSPARLLDPGVSLAHAAAGWTTLSIYPHDTISELIKFLAYLSAFVLAAHLFDSATRKSLLVRALIYLGVFEAAYGTFQYLTGVQKIFTYTKRYYTEEGTGTYINHNHFAGLLELTLPFAAASVFYFFQLWSQSRQDAARRRVSAGAGSMGVRCLFYLFLLLIMVVGIVYSRSRGGILAATFSLVFIALLGQIKTGRKVWMLGVFFFVMAVAGYGLWIGLGPVLGRFEAMREANYFEIEGRVPVWRDALHLIRDYALTGTGLGTFRLSFRHYQTSMVNFYFDHTHNDYLEFASDTGLPGAALLFLPVLYLLVRMTVSFLSDQRRYRRAITLACIGSTVALLVHSVMDFNLQIPANALIFAVVLGIGYKAACLEPRAEVGKPGASSVRPVGRPV